jgi:putative intracellular protease/amidase
MKKRKCFLFVFNGFADWEPAMAIAHLHKHTDFSTHAFSADGRPVTSMGNLQVLPEFSVNEIDVNEIDLLMLPGGYVWESGGNTQVATLLSESLKREKSIAAICGATVFLASRGYLDHTYHTSNGLPYIKKMAPAYKGDRYYKEEPCVVDKNLITANGAAMIEFAIAIFKQFELMDPDTIQKLKDLYKSGGMDNRFYD